MRPLVSALSAEIPSKFHHGDEITVGGVITSYFDFNMVTPGQTLLKPDEKEKDAGVYVNVDDGVGKIILVLPQSLFLQILAESDGKLIGKTVLGVGNNIILNKSTTYLQNNKQPVTIPTHPNAEPPRVFCFDAKLI